MVLNKITPSRTKKTSKIESHITKVETRRLENPKGANTKVQYKILNITKNKTNMIMPKTLQQ